MSGSVKLTAKRAKAGFLGIAAIALAIPAASAFAVAEDPAQSAAAAAPLSAEDVATGRDLFNDWSCGACHALSDARGSGQIGPALDGNAKLDMAFTVQIVSDGQGAMPGFGGQMTDEEIALLSAYIVQVKK